MSSVIKDQNVKALVEVNVSSDFGLTVEQVAEKCKGFGRFRAWLNSDVTRIKEVLNVVKSNGVSPAFFASYEKTEGYNSKWGWLNHTRVNGTPVQDAGSVSRWVRDQSKIMTSNPAWIDYANYNDFVPSSVKKRGNEHFKTLPSGSVGRVIIAGTAAATWEVYYPNGLKKAYNGVQNYGAPIKSIVDTIISWGGKIEGGVESSFEGNIVDFYLDLDPENHYISSPYGFRYHPITGELKMHAGEDVAKRGNPSPQTPVPAESEIIHSQFNSSAGNFVAYKPIDTEYMIGIFHLEAKVVSKGDILSEGESIGIMGATGGVTGRHWHIEVRDLNRSSYWQAKHYDPKSITFILGGEDGGTGGDATSDDYIHLYLSGAVKNWQIR